MEQLDYNLLFRWFVGGAAAQIDGRTTRHLGYAASQVLRKLVEHPFGWLKSAAGLRQVKHRGRDRVDLGFNFGMAVYNLVRLRKLIEAPA
jgi:hypothetical protein